MYGSGRERREFEVRLGRVAPRAAVRQGQRADIATQLNQPEDETDGEHRIAQQGRVFEDAAVAGDVEDDDEEPPVKQSAQSYREQVARPALAPEVVDEQGE